MQPNYPENYTQNINSYPGQPAPLPGPPKKRWPFSGKITIILAMVIALIVLAVVAALLSRDPKGDSDKKGNGNDLASLYIKRAGYENAGEGIGDPLALISKSTGKVVQYGGADVVQACTVITIKDVRDAGLKIELNQLTGSIQRTYMDGQGPGILSKGSSLFLPFDTDSNNCQYYTEDKGKVEITVYQPNYTNLEAISYELGRKYTQGADMERYRTYTKEVGKDDPNETILFLRSPNLSTMLRIDTPDKAAKDKLMKLLPQRLSQAASTATAIERFDYESPIFNGKVVNACELTDNAAFKAILASDSGPYVQESFSSVVGVISEYGTEKLFNYTANDCKRRSPEGSTKDKTLIVNTQTYETVEGAIASTKYDKTSGSTQNLQAISPVIGDESFYGDTPGLEKALVIRKGRVIVNISYYVPQGNSAISAAQRIQATIPLATAIAEKLKGF